MAIETHIIDESTNLMEVAGNDLSGLYIALTNEYIKKIFDRVSVILSKIGLTRVKTNENTCTEYMSNASGYYEYYSYGNSMKYVQVCLRINSVGSDYFTLSFAIISSLDSTTDTSNVLLQLKYSSTVEYKKDSEGTIVSTVGARYTSQTGVLKTVKNSKGIGLLRNAVISGNISGAIITTSDMLGSANIYFGYAGSTSNKSEVTLYDSEKTYYLGNKILFGCGGTLDSGYIVAAPVYLADGYETNSKLYHDKKVEGLLQTNNTMQDGALYNIDGKDHYAVGAYMLMEC